MNQEPSTKSPFWRRWIADPLIQQLSQGSEPRKLALAVAFGITLGLFPILGTPTVVSLVVGFALRLNQPVLQVFRELAYPLHLATVLVFVKAGESLYGVPHTHLTVRLIVRKFSESPASFFREYGMLAVYATSVWLIIAPALVFLLYHAALPLVTGLLNRLRARHGKE